MVAGCVRTNNVVIGSVKHKFLAIDSVRAQHMVIGDVRKNNVVIGSVKHKFLTIDSVRTQHYGDR